jgi:hypothetical protein
MIMHELDDELVLYDPEIDRSHRLNVCATVIFRNCDGVHTPEDIAHVLTERFEVPFERALPDTLTALQRMQSEHIVEY